MKIDKLIKGNIRFREKYFAKYEQDFQTLVKQGQKPKTLFIGCSDSRVVPDLIVDANPGDMFILRNVGNFVPPFKADNDFHGSAAAIEYAVSILKVKYIVVCGHSHCGACAALYDDMPKSEELVHVRKWLSLGIKAKEHTLSVVDKNARHEEILRATERFSITFQLQNLLTYPAIRARLKDGSLTLHGWYYKIEDGTIEYYDEDKKEFIELKESE